MLQTRRTHKFQVHLYDIECVLSQSWEDIRLMEQRQQRTQAKFTLIFTLLALAIVFLGPRVLNAIYENTYSSSANSLQQSIEKGNFKITLAKLGHYSHLPYDMFFYGFPTYFRVDLTVTSIASTPRHVYESEFHIIDNVGNQYDSQYAGTLELGDIYPGVTRTGYLLFPALKSDASSITLVVRNQASLLSVFVYEFKVNLR